MVGDQNEQKRLAMVGSFARYQKHFKEQLTSFFCFCFFLWKECAGILNHTLKLMILTDCLAEPGFINVGEFNESTSKYIAGRDATRQGVEEQSKAIHRDCAPNCFLVVFIFFWL